MGDFSRRGFVKAAAWAGAASMLGMGLYGCGGGQNAADQGSNTQSGADAAGASRKDSVIIAMNTGSEPAAGFDPCIAWGCGEHVHEPLIQSTLITTNQELEFVNDLATSYECSEDGLLWTFEIRDDVSFSDGKPLTAADVAFTINTVNESAKSQADLSSVKKAVAISDTVVELRMAKPNNALLYTLAVLGIVPEQAYGNNYGAAPIGSGRYLLEQWDKGQQVIFTANPSYYGDAPLMQRVVVLFMEEDAALAAVQAGQVDIAFTSATMSSVQVNDYELFSCASVDSRGISLPTAQPKSPRRDGMDGEKHDVGNAVTSDIAVRRAINYAVDRDIMIQNVLNGYGSAAYSVGDGMPWSSDDMRVERDVQQAADMLAQAGWTAGDDGILVKDGTRCAFDLLYATGDSVRQAIAYEFSNQMKELGIEVTPKGGDWDTELYPHQFDTPILWGWGSNSPVELYELTYSKGWGNVAAYDDDVVDAHLDAALAAQNIEDSYAEYKKAQWDEEKQTGIAPKGAATWVWLANVDHLYFKRPSLQVAEQKPHPHGHGWSLVNNVDRWSWS